MAAAAAAAPAAARQPATRPLPAPPSELEQKIFGLLLDVTARYELATVLRVAGGWVRNKLLGIDAGADIDICLEGNTPAGELMTGERFAEFVRKYQQEKGLEARHFGVIHANPDQSKHLETATTHIYGESIDLVHLRTEDYADSRIPTVRAGTPEEDARRRDLTVNAMFYNLHTQLVEDWTTGFEDLEARVARTPLPPLETFRDDPLRLLRTIRFASTYSLTVAPEVDQAGREQAVREDLSRKVSRERMGIEVQKMMGGPDPSRALRLVGEYGLCGIVFRRTALRKETVLRDAPLEWDGPRWGALCAAAGQAAAAAPKPERSSAVFGAVLHSVHCAALAAEEAEAGAGAPRRAVLWAKEQCEQLGDEVVKNGLKLPERLGRDSAAVACAAHALCPLARRLAEARPDAAAVAAALQPRGSAAAAPDAEPSLRYRVAMVLRLASDKSKDCRRQGLVPAAVAVAWCAVNPDASGAAAELAAEVGRAVEGDAQLRDAVLQPPLRGEELISRAGISRGPAVGFMMELQSRYLVECPGAGVDAIAAFLAEHKGVAPAPPAKKQ
eukprot:TRINITY_DN4301_c0_g2_i1.p1 TRINITY_DN4301_c0_g2~~TRINITY_DN4301_c0_g2_i1.p1  ORF type:complete len:587 (+),score=236.23 TRINITY_DN4301_c0_g2_i1:92-1762(+)